MTEPSFPVWSEEPLDESPPRGGRTLDPLLAGLCVGLIGSALGVDGPLGVNATLAFLSFAAVGALGWRRARPGDRRERLAGLAGAAIFSLGFVRTENETLRLLDTGAAAFLISLPLLRPACARLAEIRPLPLLHALVESALHSWIGAVLLIPARLGGAPRRDSTPRRSPLAPVLAGSGAAILLVLLFGSLLRASDAVFDGWVAKRVDAEWLAERAAVLCAIAWFATGWLHGCFARPLGERAAFPAADPLQLRAPAVLIPLVSLLVLFGGFVGVQAAYLFPGERPAPEALSAIARRGFFELVAVGGLSLPLLLAADSALRYAGRAVRIAFTAGAGTLLLLVGAILASAAVRLGLYIDRFGWTESRLFAAVFLGWTAVALAWFAATALAGAPQRFLPGALAAALAIGIGLHAVSPEGMIVASHLDREVAANGGAIDGAKPGIDYDYLRTLGVGAVPAIAARWDRIPEDERLHFGVIWLIEREEERPARAWNLARARAERIIARMFPEPEEG